MTNETGSKDEQPTEAPEAASTTEGPGFTVQEGESPASGAERLPTIDFSTFVLSLSTSAVEDGPEGGLRLAVGGDQGLGARVRGGAERG